MSCCPILCDSCRGPAPERLVGRTVDPSDRREARRQKRKGGDGDGETEADEGKVGADSVEEEQVVVELELAGISRWSAAKARVTIAGVFNTGQMSAPTPLVTSRGAEEDEDRKSVV